MKEGRAARRQERRWWSKGTVDKGWTAPKLDPYRRLPQKNGSVERLFFHSTFPDRRKDGVAMNYRWPKTEMVTWRIWLGQERQGPPSRAMGEGIREELGLFLEAPNSIPSSS